MYQKKWFQTLIALILILVLFLLLSSVSFIFVPVGAYFKAIAIPMIIAGILYYITKPLVSYLVKRKVPKTISILLVFVLLVGVITLVITYIAPIAQRQVSLFLDNFPAMVNHIEDLLVYWQQNQAIIPAQFNDTINSILDNIEQITFGSVRFVVNAISQIIGVVFLLILVPFFLFYMLKDGEKFIPFVTKFFSERKATSLKKLLTSIDRTLSAFIQGQLTVSLFVGILLYIGYLIIGLNYSLTLALFGLITNVIPFAGPYLAVAPAILVAIFQDPHLIIYVIIVMIIAQQIEGNFISPNIMGKALNIHPLTIITLILAAGSIAGFVGLLFIIPIYAVTKAIVSHFYQEWKTSKIR